MSIVALIYFSQSTDKRFSVDNEGYLVDEESLSNSEENNSRKNLIASSRGPASENSVDPESLNDRNDRKSKTIPQSTATFSKKTSNYIQDSKNLENRNNERAFDDYNSAASFNSRENFNRSGENFVNQPNEQLPLDNTETFEQSTVNDFNENDTSGNGFAGDFGGNNFAPPVTDTTDTTEFDSVGDGSNRGINSPDASGSFTDQPPICVANKAPGTYIAEFSLNLSCNQPSKIYYCISVDQACCDPSVSGIEYNESINIGNTDGDYCVSFYGQSRGTLLTSDLDDVLYDVDSALPSIATYFPKIQVQSTELPLAVSTQSLDYGRNNHFLHQVNTKTVDPATYSWDCSSVLTEYNLIPEATLSLNAYYVSELNPSNQVDQQLTLSSLDFGENYLTTILEDRDRGLMGCQTQAIKVEDFQLFTMASSAPQSSTPTQPILSGFTSYSHFQETPNPGVSGSGESSNLGSLIEEGFLAITH